MTDSAVQDSPFTCTTTIGSSTVAARPVSPGGGVLSAGLPNPTWLDGSVHVEGQLFGGLISINTDASFTIGDKCYPTPNPLGDVQIISDWGPRDSASVFAYPYVAANVGLNENYDVEVPPTIQYPNGETRTFRFSLLSYTVAANNVNAPGIHLQYQNNNTTGVLTHDATLQPNTVYTATIVCNAMQWYPDENRWDNPYSDQDGQRALVDLCDVAGVDEHVVAALGAAGEQRGPQLGE